MFERISTPHSRLVYDELESLEKSDLWLNSLMKIENWIEQETLHEGLDSYGYLYFFSLDKEDLLKTPFWCAKTMMGPPLSRRAPFKSYDLYAGEAFSYEYKVDSLSSLSEVVIQASDILKTSPVTISSTWRIKLSMAKNMRLWLEVFQK